MSIVIFKKCLKAAFVLLLKVLIFTLLKVVFQKFSFSQTFKFTLHTFDLWIQ